MDVASLQVIIETKGVEAAQRELYKLGGTAGKAEKSVGGLASSMKALGAVATVGAIAQLGKQAIVTADSMNLLDARLKLATSSLEEFTSQQKELFNISKASFSELKGITDLYIKLDPALKRLGASTQAVNAVTSSFAKGLQVGGASAQESASAILQFSQAMGSGVLRGEEFNAIAEASPKLMKYMADGMGVPITAMRQLAQDGKLTADVVSIALLKMTQDIDKDFKELPVTMGKAFTNIKTDLSKLSQEFDKTSGITKTLSDLMVDLSDDLYEYSGTVFTSLNDISNIVKSSATDISMLSKEVFKLLEVFDNASKEGTGLGLFKSSLLGLKVVIDTMYVGLNNSIVLMTELARTSKNFFEDEKLSKDFLTRVNSQILTLDDLEKKYIETYKTIIKTQEGFKKPTQDQIAIDLQKEIKTIESRGKALKAEDDRKKEATKQQEKAQKDAIKLAEEWQKRKIEIATNISISEQDELAKPFIVLEAKYKQDLEHFKGNKEAQIMLTNEYNAEVSRLQKDLTEKFNEEEKKKAEKAIEWQIKILEANEKYNDEIIKMQDEMYGTDSSVEQWYNNQLEYLGKLSQEAGATSEELQTLLDKIETIKAMKLEKQTISFKVEQSFYQSFESNLADSIEGAFNGKLNLSSFFSNIGRSVLGTFSGGIANNITTGLRTGSFASGLKALGLGSTSAAASDGGILSDLSTLSTIKSLYGLASDGLSSTVMSGFSGLSNLTGISGISQFGYGFTNPFANSQLAGLYGSGVPQLSGLSSIGATAGGMALGGLGGYALGTIGDKIFGAKTKAGTYGAIGGAIGSVIPAIGTIAGAAIGSLIGGMFGSTKQTDAGLSFGTTTGMGSGFDEIQAYADMKKKSWFSSKKWTNYTDLTQSEINQIKGIFDTYDYLLAQLGDTDRIILEAGKYTGQSFQDVVAKKFIEAFTDVSQSTDGTIYQAWVKYAESVDSTVIEALSASINTFIATTRSFDVWALNRSGKGIEALAKQAQWAQEDFSNLSNMLGVTGVTVENYTQMYREAVKNSFSPETITQWQSLGTALQSATNASDTYLNTLKAQNEAIRQSTLSILGQQLTDWISALGSIQNALDNLNPTFMTFAELANQTVNLDNYSTLLSQLEKTRQNEIEKLTQSSNERIKQLEDEKTLFTSISDFVDELTQKIIGFSVTTSSYFFRELANAKALITTGGTPDISALKNSATSYLDKVLGQSTSRLEYLREVAKVSEGIGGLGSLATGGSLEGIENAINEEQKSLENQLTQLNETAANILNSWKGQAVSGVSSTTDRFNSINNDIVSKAYSEVLGRTADAGGYKYWTSQVASGALAAADLKNAIAQSALQFDLSKNTSGVSNEILSKSIANAQQWVNGSHANGLDYVPFDGYVAELHKGERVQTASEVQKDSIIQELQNSLKDLKDMFIKNIAETSRMSRVITRLDDNDALLVRVVV